jgi:hypothetical protein
MGVKLKRGYHTQTSHPHSFSVAPSGQIPNSLLQKIANLSVFQGYFNEIIV